LCVGKFGLYAGLLAPALLVLGAVASFFVTMNQVLYPMVLAVYVWTTGRYDDVTYKSSSDTTFEWFSSNYTAMFLFIVITAICSKKDLKVFMRVGSFGVIFVVMLMIFIIYTGINSMSNTDFSIGTTEESNKTDWKSD
jgi:hypothetical protein